MRMKLDNRFHKLEVAMRQVQADVKGIKNIVGKETQDRLEALEEFATYADNMLTELNHALPDPEYDAKCEAEVADVEASLDRHRERLGLNKPQLKQLDQSVFDGEPEQIKWAVITNEGAVLKFELEPVVKDGLWHWTHSNGCRQHSLIGQYDASDWQNSLIERESKELTGSELCKAMLARGDKYILCLVGDGGDYRVANQGYAFIVTGVHSNGEFDTPIYTWEFAVPINNQGEPLTAAEAGL